MMNVEVLAFVWTVGRKPYLTGLAARDVVLYNMMLIVDTRPEDGPIKCEVRGGFVAGEQRLQTID